MKTKEDILTACIENNNLDAFNAIGTFETVLEAMEEYVQQYTVICANCRCKEKEEIEKDEKIESLKQKIYDAKIDIENWKQQLKELEG